MTLILATASRHVGHLSADTLAYSHRQFGPLEAPELDGTAEAAFNAAWGGDGTPPRVTPLWYEPKIHAIPRLGLAVGHAGAVAIGLGWVDMLHRAPVRGIDDLDHIAPLGLKQLVARFPEHPEAALLHVGWSARQQCVVGRMYRSFNDFAPEAFANGTFSGTPIHPEFDGYDRANELVEPASHGVGIEELHTAVAGNVEAAYRAGRALRWFHFGGELLTIKVDRNGVSAPRPIYRFADADHAQAGQPSSNAIGFPAWQPPQQVGGLHDYFMKQVLGQ